MDMKQRRTFCGPHSIYWLTRQNIVEWICRRK